MSRQEEKMQAAQASQDQAAMTDVEKLQQKIAEVQRDY